MRVGWAEERVPWLGVLLQNLHQALSTHVVAHALFQPHCPLAHSRIRSRVLDILQRGKLMSGE